MSLMCALRNVPCCSQSLLHNATFIGPLSVSALSSLWQRPTCLALAPWARPPCKYLWNCGRPTCDEKELNASLLLPHVLGLQLCSVAKGQAHSFPHNLSAPHHTSSCLFHAKNLFADGAHLSCYFWPFLGNLLFAPVWNLRCMSSYWCS